MITYTTTRRVERAADEAFDVIGTNVYDNHPRWEAEVLEIRRITPDPVGVGSRAVMVRRDYGRRTEVVYEVTEFEPDRLITFHHPSAGLDFRIRFELAAINHTTCDLQVDIHAQPKGWMRLLEPVMRRAMPKQSERITSAMVDVIEDAPARTNEAPRASTHDV